jgi:hypothetical protein
MLHVNIMIAKATWSRPSLLLRSLSQIQRLSLSYLDQRCAQVSAKRVLILEACNPEQQAQWSASLKAVVQGFVSVLDANRQKRLQVRHAASKVLEGACLIASMWGSLGR